MVTKPMPAAHYGLKDWVIQRLTAVVMLIFMAIFIAGLFFIPGTYEGWRLFFSHILVKIIAQIIVLAVVAHAWVGVRDIWMDYLPKPKIRLFMDTFSAVWLLVSLVYSISIIWGA